MTVTPPVGLPSCREQLLVLAAHEQCMGFGSTGPHPRVFVKEAMLPAFLAA